MSLIKEFANNMRASGLKTLKLGGAWYLVAMFFIVSFLFHGLYFIVSLLSQNKNNY